MNSGVLGDLGQGRFRFQDPFSTKGSPPCPGPLTLERTALCQSPNWVGGYDEGSMALTGRWGWRFSKQTDTPLPSQGTGDPD